MNTVKSRLPRVFSEAFLYDEIGKMSINGAKTVPEIVWKKKTIILSMHIVIGIAEMYE